MVGKRKNSSEKGSKKVSIILAAGMGKRLQPLTLNMPKCLISVAGKPILEHQIESLVRNGIKCIYVVIGYKSSLIVDYFSNHKFSKYINIVINEDYENTNNLYSLYLIMNVLADSSVNNFDSIILLNGDVIFDDTIITDMLKNGLSKIAIDYGKYYNESMKVVVNKSNFIKNISKNINQDECYGTSIDIYYFNKKSWLLLENIVFDMVENNNLVNVWTEEAIKLLVNKFNLFIPLNIKNRFWYEIDTLDDLKEATRLFVLNNHLNQLIEKKLYIFDMDGTLIIGNESVNGAKNFLKYLLYNNKCVAVITNNSSISKNLHIIRLNNIFNIGIKNNQLFTSIDHVMHYLKNNDINNIYLLATESVKQEFINNNFYYDENNPQAVVVGFDKSLTYSKLEKASKLLLKNKKFILINKDIRCPVKNGYIPDAGSIAKILEITTDKSIDFIAGKPNPELIFRLIEMNNIEKEDCVFFGDRLYTDIKMGIESGVLTILMMTGEAMMVDLDLNFLNNTIVLKNFNELLNLIS